jgi:hypothetical protein
VYELQFIQLNIESEVNFMDSNGFCPFCNGQCRSDCVFRMQAYISSANGLTKCLIATKLSDINTYQSDQLTEISNKIEE